MRHRITLRAVERYGDPRCCQVDVDASWEKVGDILGDGGEPDRAMPLRDEDRFVKLLERATRTFRAVDGAHFWVSGYYSVHFESSRPVDRRRAKAIVESALAESGGFITAGEWCGRHEGGAGNATLCIATGTGGNITYSTNLNPAYL